MMEIKDCNSCVYQSLCKFREERKEVLGELNTKLSDILNGAPEWIKFQAGNSHIGCADFKAVRITDSCKDCKHCIRTEERTSRGYIGFRCKLIEESKPFGFSRKACEKFEPTERN